MNAPIEPTFPELKKNHAMLVRRYNAMVNAAEGQNTAIEKLRSKIVFLEKQLENAQKQIEIQKTINHNLITEMNVKANQYAEEMAVLTARK